MREPPPEGVVYELEEAFVLYRRAIKLVDMGNAFSPYVFGDFKESGWQANSRAMLRVVMS